MAGQSGSRKTTTGEPAPTHLTVAWAAQAGEDGAPCRWLGSWLLDAQGVEGAWFYSGLGGDRTTHTIPAGALGVRIRRWASEGMDPEYADLPLDGHEVSSARHFSRLSATP